MSIILQASAWGAAMIVLLWLIRRLTRKGLSRAVMPWLWMVALVRLLAPMPGLAATAHADGIDALVAPGPSPVTWIWLVGMAVCALVLCIGRLIWMYRLRDAAFVGTRGMVPVYTSAQVSSPMVCGLARPKVYVPKHFDPQALNLVMLHEEEHIRGKHLWAKAAMRMAICVHWFNPLVWTMAAWLFHDMELACDARVVQRLSPADRAAYAHLLVSMGTRRAKDA